MNQDVDPEVIPDEMPSDDVAVQHYYGDYVRRLFLGGAVGELAILPFFHDLMPILPVFMVIIVTLAVVWLAGLTAPRNRFVGGLNVVIAAILFFVFEYYAVDSYYSANVFLSLARQGLALVYLVAVYYGVKTVRNMETGKIKPKY